MAVEMIPESIPYNRELTAAKRLHPHVYKLTDCLDVPMLYQTNEVIEPSCGLKSTDKMNWQAGKLQGRT